MRQTAREVLRELLPEVLGALQTAPANGNGHGHASAVPLVPAPPVAAVLRPSTWTGPATPGEMIGDETAVPPAGLAEGAEAVTLDTDADLERFVARCCAGWRTRASAGPCAPARCASRCAADRVLPRPRRRRPVRPCTSTRAR